MRLEFPWPPRELSPNSRAHWRQVARMKATYKEDCGWVILAERGWVDGPTLKPQAYLKPPVTAQVTFRCDRRRRDPDNTMAMLKPLWDALVDVGLLIDDNKDVLTIKEPKWEVGKPLVIVELEETR